MEIIETDSDSDKINELYLGVCKLLGEKKVKSTFDDEGSKKIMDIDTRIKILEEYALTIIETPGFDPDNDYIRFRKIRLLKLNRVHSLLVERDPKKWIKDVNEAVDIAISSRPVALCAVENRIHDYTRGIVEVFYDEDKDLTKGVVFVWGPQIADCRGPIENVLDILEKLNKDRTEGLTIQPFKE